MEKSDLPSWRKWSLKHGHLLEMGGFTLIDPDQKYAEPNEQNAIVLTLDYFKKNPDIEIPEISAADIEDRSKGDALSKIIAILQTTWFIVQCVARGQQRIALTELELVTLALASLNAVTYAIWWHKPLGVQEPIKIYLKMKVVEKKGPTRQVGVSAFSVEDSERFAGRWPYLFQRYHRKSLKDINENLSWINEVLRNPCQVGPAAFLAALSVVPFSLTYVITFPFFVLFPLGIVLLLRIVQTEPVRRQVTSPSRGLLATRIVESLQIFRYWLMSVVSKFVENRLAEIFGAGHPGRSGVVIDLLGWYILLPLLFIFLFLFIIVLIPFSTFFFLVSFIFIAVFGIVTTSSIRPGASHVPSFYAPITQSDRWSRMVVFALFGVIFGGLHCVGWSFEFPTHTEQTLWRSTSLAITAIPLIVAPIDFLLATRLRSRDIKSCGRLERVAFLTLDLIMTILLFIYVPARLSLIAQALALLRSQPPSALTAVVWTKYLPHLFST
jgi:hypothetical protein